MSARQIGSGPIQDPATEALMNAIARATDSLFNGEAAAAGSEPRRVGFLLMVFPFGVREGRCNYISSAEPDDLKVLLREQLAYLEGMPETEGHG